MNKLIAYAADVDMRKGWDGLNKIRRLNGLGKGEFVAFVNRAKNKIKLATGHDMVAYHRLEKGDRLDPRVIKYLPEFFNGSSIEYDRAVEKMLRGTFPKWFESQKEEKE